MKGEIIEVEYRSIILEKGPIARITLNRPEKRNALSGEMMEELIHAFQEVDQDALCRVVILEGSGKGFCAGGDLGSMGENSSILDARMSNQALVRLLTTIMKIGKIVISKIHGHALAGGLGMAVSCDLTVLAENAKIGTPEILRSLFPFMITASISRCMPQKKMLEMCFTGENLSPAQAVDLGIANYVCPPEQLEDVVMELANKIARHSPAAIRLGKAAIYTQRDMEYSKALDYLAECLTTIRQTHDAKEGITAFLEKRDPIWTGK